MPQCKMSGCREPADPKARKRHCTQHMNEYNRKRREYEKRQAALPQCAAADQWGERCTNKVPPNRVDFCKDCQDAFDREDEEDRRARAVAERVAHRDAALQRCDTVAELRGFIEEWLL